MRLRQLFEAEEKVQVILYFEDGTQQVLTDVPRSVTERPNFIDILIRNARDKLDKVVVRYAIGGEEFQVGNRDGRTPDTPTPPVITSRDSDDTVQQRPEEVPQVSTGEPERRDEPQVTPPPAREEPPQAEPSRQEPPATRPQARPEPRPSEPDTTDDDRASRRDEPQRSEPAPSDSGRPPMSVDMVYVDREGYQTDREGNRLRNSRGEEIFIGGGGVDLPRAGGGEEGAAGDSGQSGAEGAITGDQRAAIPEIIDELHDAMSGPGTSEGRLIAALNRIESPEHLEAVNQQYREKYGSNLGDDIIGEFKYDLGSNSAAQIAEINRATRRLGWQITGSRFSTMRWQQAPASESGGGNVQPTAEEQSQLDEAQRIRSQIMDFARDGGTLSDVPAIQYTNAEGRRVTLRNPSRELRIPDKDLDEWSAQDEIDLKRRIADLFPGISVATGSPDDGRQSDGSMRITIDYGRFVPDRGDSA